MTGIFGAMIRKEALHIVRDRRTMLITLFMPIVLLLLFGFAISTEVNSVRVVAVVDVQTDQTRELLSRLGSNEYFRFYGVVSMAEAEPMLRRGAADAAVVIRHDHGRPMAQIMVDASNTPVAKTMTAYLTSVVAGSKGSKMTAHTLFNPQMRSAYNFVPGIMGMIFILVCAIMTSVSIVSEKESGTMDLLLVSPVRPSTIIFGKLVPYFILSAVLLAVMLAMAYGVLGIPLSATLTSVVAVSLLYIILSLSIGLLVSTLASTQVSALIISAILFMLPVILLSGMIFPIDNMPAPLQWLSCAIPARWYTQAMRTLMIQQSGPGYVVTEVTVLAAMTVAVLTAAILKFKNTR